MAHLGPLMANHVLKKFLKKYVSYSPIINLWIQMNFRMFIFNWSPKNGHYLNPPIFPPKNAKRENTHILRGHKSRSYQFFYEIFFWVSLQVLPFQKFIVGKISHSGLRRGQSIMLNLRKIDFKLVFCYISPCNFLWKLTITHFLSIKIENKKFYGFVELLHIFWSKKRIIGLYGHFGPLWAPKGP